jgi:hypothetical protein
MYKCEEPVLAISLLVSVFVGLLLLSIIERKEKAIFRYLEKHHKELWLNLDMKEEGFISIRSIRARFSLQKKYSGANDPELNGMCNKFETLGKVASICGLFVVVLGSIYIFVIPWLQAKNT